MSLTNQDLQQMRNLFEEYVRPLDGRLEAVENDVKEIYKMLSRLQKDSVFITDRDFRKKPAQERILILHAEIVAAAKELGVTLPRA